MVRVLKQDVDGISGLDILLDETICEGQILVDRRLLIRAGGINQYLSAKKKYELLIRVAFETPVTFVDEQAETGVEYVLLDDEENTAEEDGWKTDCYVTGRYSRKLQELGLLDNVITSLLTEAEISDRKQETVTFLEQMISKGEQYWKIAEGSCPILIYKGEDICYNVLNVFAEQFGNALTEAGKKIIYFDCEKNDINMLTRYMHQHFQAVIGVQTYLFSVKMKDGIHYLHEYIYGPKFNFCFDHPVWMMRHMVQHYRDFYILTHDANYVAFIERYFNHNAIFFPPAGIVRSEEKELERIYDLTFIGTYGNYWNEVMLIHQMERKKRFLANQFLLTMRKNPEYTAEQALDATLRKRAIVLSDKEFLDLLYELRRVIYCVMHYYRECVLREILETGIRLDVFGDSWAGSPLKRYTNLICHSDVTVEESLNIWKQSKLSLNIMSWHKGGFTERMANIMLSGAVLVTDDTTYLAEEYTGEDLITFSLGKRKLLPDKIQSLLKDEKRRQTIAENGCKKTLQQHTWKRRAEQFLELLYGMSAGS